MLNISDRTTTNTVLNTFTALGVKPPKDLADAFTQAETITAKAPHLGGSPGDLESAVTAAMIRNRMKATAEAKPRFHHLKPCSYMK